VPARVTPSEDGFRLDLSEPAYGVARGQIAVVYDDDAVVGAGVITDVSAANGRWEPSNPLHPGEV
jgi:tRNA U34 2-thiouridine synthase MnmA/TrmU